MHADVAGGRYYGWYPMARYVDMTVYAEHGWIA